MKRKRGNKKGKAKRTPAEFVNETTHNAISVNTEDDSGMDEGNDELDSGMEVETPSSGGTGNGLPEKPEANNSDKLAEKAKGNLVYGRVKVKIKNKKTLDSLHASSDAPTQSDTDKSSPQVDMERLGVVCEKMEDSANSLLDYGNSSKKSGSIKIKSSRMLGSTSLNGCSTKAQLLGDKTYKKEPDHPLPDAQPNRQELQASLEVIKKVMKMDAAEPFNAPVNPIALGIPDYFQVIDTPMDFGTICSNLESGVKYKNSEDVFKDVRLVWENCYKYNNKGDYVVELMKRVKKNLMKYWTAAGLLTETSQGTSESMQGNDTSTPSNAKFPGKSGSAKHKNKKRHGVKKHKDDCLCAICVMMRRRQEREESNQPSEDRMESISSRQVKLEETTAAESQYSGDTSSNMDNSEGPDADAELEEKDEEVKLLVATSEKQTPMQEKENEMTIELKENDEIIEQSEPNEQSTQEHERDYPMRVVQSGRNNRTDGRKEEISLPQEGEAEKEKSKTTTEEERQKDKMYESLRRLENPMLLELCGALFPNNNDDKSAWRGPHSLVGRQGPARRRSSIHEAIATFLK